ncbi:MAG: XdhC family protein [Bacillota bacterium]|nr:XdhC family protein [Bacillota bacterium]
MNTAGMIADLLRAGRSAVVITFVGEKGGLVHPGQKMLLSGEQILFSDFSEADSARIKEAFNAAAVSEQNLLFEAVLVKDGKRQFYAHFYTLPPRLIILGGGNVGGALCRIAALLDFEIVLVDDRPSFASGTLHPHAHRLICDSFEKAIDQLVPSGNDYIVIVTRGHRHDRLCLEKVLERETAYIGMIGSRHRVRTQLQDMADHGYSPDQLARVHTPIGLSIGAVTEAEIAVSIMAEIIQVRRSGSNDEAIQKNVLQELLKIEKNQDRAVLVTLIKTLGSTPRKAGSQLIIYPDGTVVGTIGGGCAEEEAKREALHCLDTGLARKMRQELTADAAADEGMACGGIMEIFLEPVPHSSK